MLGVEKKLWQRVRRAEEVVYQRVNSTGRRELKYRSPDIGSGLWIGLVHGVCFRKRVFVVSS